MELSVCEWDAFLPAALPGTPELLLEELGAARWDAGDASCASFLENGPVWEEWTPEHLHEGSCSDLIECVGAGQLAEVEVPPAEGGLGLMPVEQPVVAPCSRPQSRLDLCPSSHRTIAVPPAPWSLAMRESSADQRKGGRGVACSMLGGADAADYMAPPHRQVSSAWPLIPITPAPMASDPAPVTGGIVESDPCLANLAAINAPHQSPREFKSMMVQLCCTGAGHGPSPLWAASSEEAGSSSTNTLMRTSTCITTEVGRPLQHTSSPGSASLSTSMNMPFTAAITSREHLCPATEPMSATATGHSSWDTCSEQLVLSMSLPPTPGATSPQPFEGTVQVEAGAAVLPLTATTTTTNAAKKRSRQDVAANAKGIVKRPSKRMSCWNCGAHSTPQWRCGPDGPRTLCNACGVRYKKGLPLAYKEVEAQQQQQAEADPTMTAPEGEETADPVGTATAGDCEQSS